MEKQKPRAIMGRPKIEFLEKDWQLMEYLCSIQCTGDEIAGALQCSYETVQERIKERYSLTFPEYFKTFAGEGKASLRKSMWHNATQRNNAALQIWLSKQHLGMKETVLNELDFKNEKLTIVYGGDSAKESKPDIEKNKEGVDRVD